MWAARFLWFRPPRRNEPPPLRFSIGTKLAEYGRYEDAIRQFQAIPADQTDSATQFNLGLAWSHLARYKEARQCYFAAIDKDPNHVDAYLRTGMDFSLAGDRPKAIPWLLRAWRMAPDRADSAYALAQELIAAKFYQTALGVLDKASALRPGDPLLLVARGDYLLEQQKTVEATEAYRRALDLSRNNTAASVGLARALAADRKRAEAVRMLTAVLGHDPQHGDANAVLGRMEAGEGKFPAALPYLLRAWGAGVPKWSIAIDLARCYRRAGQAAKALEILRSVSADMAGEPSYHYELAQLYTGLKRTADARKEMAEFQRLEAANREGPRLTPPGIYVH